MVCPRLRDEFRLKMFGFSGVRAERFCFSQWRLPVALYMIYRFVLMGYGLFWLGFNSVHRGNPPQPWGAYLTIWTYVLLNIYLVVHFLAASLYHILMVCDRGRVLRVTRYLFCRPNMAAHACMFTELNRNLPSVDGYEEVPGSENSANEVETAPSSRPPLYICVTWILFNIVSSAAVMVTFVFFIFLFHTLPDYPHISLENLQEHLLNSVIIVVEHLITGAPYRLLHVVYPFLYGVIYMSFSVIFWAGDHERVMYPILDWNKPGPTVGYVFMVGFVFIPVLHLLFFLIYKVKIAIYQQVSCSDSDL